MPNIIITPERLRQVSEYTQTEREDDSSRVSFLLKNKFRRIAGDRRLGVVWILLDPIIIASVYLFVFSVLRASANGATVFIGIALIRILQDSTKSGVNAISDFSGGIKAERIRTRVLIFSSIYFRVLDSFFQSIGVVVILYLAYGVEPVGLLVILLSSVTLGIVCEGVGLNLALIARKIPDVKSIVDYILFLMFFGSPALYSLSSTSGVHRTLNLYNPFTYFAEVCRYFSGLESSVNEFSAGIYLPLMGLSLLLTYRGYAKIDELRWKVSTW
jgi:ABC-type polysaccharide/polyol phosphate export permease